MDYKWATRAVFVLVASWSAPAPARADGPVSVFGAAQFQVNTSTPSTLGTVEPDVGIGYDLGPRTPVPVRVRVDLDDYFGTGGNSGFNDFSFGASVRLTTPTYFGVGTSLDFVNVDSESYTYVYPAVVGGVVLPIGGSFAPPAPATSTDGIGVHFFAGQKLVSSPHGFGLAIEATYKFIPHVQSIDSSGFGVGLRANL